MGVDFFPCDYCSESICDCGSYRRCDCGRRWCDDKCAEKEGYNRENSDCSYCRFEEVEDVDLFKYLLKKYKLKREDVLKDYLSENSN